MNVKTRLIETVQSFHGRGLGVGTSGNASIRTKSGFLITPTGVEYDQLQENSLVELNLNGEILNSDLKPSSEWRFHAAIYKYRSEVNAIVHVHSPFATGIACTRKDIPAFHYMIARAGGDSIRCADYATFGTEELSDNAVLALKDRMACLLANHGQISLGGNIEEALSLAQEVEELSKQFWICSQHGDPVILDDSEMQINLAKFQNYGKQ